MRVSEVIDILRDHPGDAEVELAVIAPVTDDAEDITVDRYLVEGVLPWEDEPNDDDEGGLVIWLIGGDEEDVDVFLDALEHPDE